MFNKDIEKLNFIVENISNIEEITKRHDGIVNALQDKVEARPAILMAFLQIGETLNKLQNTYESLNSDDIKGAYEVRNFIAHDYMGVDIGLIEYILRDKLPELKNSFFIELRIYLYGNLFSHRQTVPA
jgi:uncharacterized protein with HEPN domain